MGRPKLDIDEKKVYQLARIDCSYAEMAAVLGCNPSTLTRRFAQVIERGRQSGNASLKRKQFKVAMEGNITMLIWLGKIKLGQKEPSATGMEFAEVTKRIYKQIDALRDALPPEEAEKAIAAIRPVWMAA